MDSKYLKLMHPSSYTIVGDKETFLNEEGEVDPSALAAKLYADLDVLVLSLCQQMQQQVHVEYDDVLAAMNKLVEALLKQGPSLFKGINPDLPPDEAMLLHLQGIISRGVPS